MRSVSAAFHRERRWRGWLPQVDFLAKVDS